MRARDVDLGLGRHPDVADRVRPGERVEAVLAAHGLGVAEVLDDLERAAEREHLGLGDVLDEVGQELQVALVVERDPERVRRLLLDLVHLRPEAREPGLDLATVQPQPLREAEVARRVRVGELVAHDERAGRPSAPFGVL